MEENVSDIVQGGRFGTRVVSQFTTQANRSVPTPRDHDRKRDKCLKNLVNQTTTETNVPNINKESDAITISGTKEEIENTEHAIMSDEQSKQAFERVNIPKVYHSFIIRLFNENLHKLHETGAKMSEITVTEENDSVFTGKTKIENIFNEIEKKWLPVNVEESKSEYRYIIGQPGSSIQEILEVTGNVTPQTNNNSDTVPLRRPQVYITIPKPNENSDIVQIHGTRAEVDKTADILLKIVNELEESSFSGELSAQISSQNFKSLIANGNELISSTVEKFGGVSIKFPTSESNSDKVIISGSKDIEKAKEQILKLANELQGTSFTSEVHANEQYRKSLIEKNGASIQDIRDRTGALIIFPENNYENKEVITIIGREENVKAAKEQLETLIKDIDTVSEDEMLIDPQYHKHFISKRYEVIHRIQEECGGVSILFPRSADDSNRVTLKGTQDGIEAAKRRIAEIVSDLQAQVMIDCDISQMHYRTIMDSRDLDATEVVGDVDNNTNKIGIQSDNIHIIGYKENAEDAKQALINLIPKTGEIIVPVNFHRLLIGRKGSNIHEFMDRFEVHLELSPTTRQLDIIKIYGTPSKIAKAEIALLDLIRDIDAQVTIDCVIPQMHHRTIMSSRRGIKIQGKFDVQIKYPDRDATEAVQRKDNDTDELVKKCDIIRINGRKEKAEAARQALIDLIPITEEINVPFDFHQIIIRQKCRIVRKFMGRYEVHVEISAPNLNVIKITGTSPNVAEAKEVLFDQIKNLVTIDCAIPQRHHNSMGSGRGVKVQCVSSEFDVPIKFLVRDAIEPVEVLGNDTGKVVRQCVLITGRKENAEAAKQALIDFIPISEEINVPFDLHELIMKRKGKQINKICRIHYVHIMFSSPTEKLDIIKIIGTPTKLAKAKEKLLAHVKDVAAYHELRSFKIKIVIDPICHQKINRRRRAAINKISLHFNVNVSFAREKDQNDPHTITIEGYEANVKAAHDEIFKIVNDVKEHANEALFQGKIDGGPKYPKFIKRRPRCHFNKKMRTDFNVNVTIPCRKVQNDSHKIANQGFEFKAKDARDEMIKIDNNIEDGVCSLSVKDIETQVTNDCVIPQRHFKTGMGSDVAKIQDVAGEFDFPDRDATKEVESLNAGTTDEGLGQCGIKITGCKKNSESAKQDLIDLSPIIEKIYIPFNLQHLITERNIGGTTLEIMRRYDVHIMLPPFAKKFDIIEISGMPSKVAEAKEALFDQIKNLNSDHDFLSFEIKIDIAPEYYFKIFGYHRIDAIKKMSNYFDVNAKIADRTGYYGSYPITIQGHEANVKAARDEIIKMCNECSKETICRMVKYIQNIMNRYEVNIKFPNANEETPNSVTVTNCE